MRFGLWWDPIGTGGRDLDIQEVEVGTQGSDGISDGEVRLLHVRE